jgi:hypothetical protein
MPRIPLRELEEARANPAAYRRTLLTPSTTQFRASYFGALRDAISRYHRTNSDAHQAREYLDRRLRFFSNAQRCDEIMEQLEWYIGEVERRRWPTFQVRPNVSVPLTTRGNTPLSCSGQLGRIDLVPTGGYAAWLFKGDDLGGWEGELRMPLIQETVASTLLSVPASEVQVGVYAFSVRQVARRTFTDREIQEARRELDRLVRAMGF